MTATLDRSVDSATMIRQIHESVMYAIARAETDRELSRVMPSEVFEAYGLPEDAPWEGDALRRFRNALWAHLGNVSVLKGEEEAFMRRYVHITPREFMSPENPSVSLYVTYVPNGGGSPYLVYEIGPAGGHDADQDD